MTEPQAETTPLHPEFRNDGLATIQKPKNTFPENAMTETTHANPEDFQTDDNFDDFPVSMSEIIDFGKAKNASDIIISANVPPMLKINGQTVPYTRPNSSPQLLTPEAAKALLFDLCEQQHKELIDGDAQNPPQRTDLDFSVPGGHGWLRVNIAYQRGSLFGVIRLIPNEVKPLDQIGIPKDYLIKLCNTKRGLVLVTGPTGSGKSTTLAAMIDHINSTSAKHIVTIEDPIEFHHQNKMSVINQREIGRDAEGFATALKSVLRQAPDVILVGELRDPTTVAAAITAAETGHLVLGTLHTNGAKETVNRILDSYTGEQQQQIKAQLATTLIGVVSQQLVRTADNKGRVVAYEIMMLNNGIRNQIRSGDVAKIDNIMFTSSTGGNIQMDTVLAKLHADGVITAERAIEFAIDPAGMEEKLKGKSVTPAETSKPSQNPGIFKRG